jgi:hypothetical protein
LDICSYCWEEVFVVGHIGKNGLVVVGHRPALEYSAVGCSDFHHQPPILLLSILLFAKSPSDGAAQQDLGSHALAGGGCEAMSLGLAIAVSLQGELLCSALPFH